MGELESGHICLHSVRFSISEAGDVLTVDEDVRAYTVEWELTSVGSSQWIWTHGQTSNYKAYSGGEMQERISQRWAKVEFEE